MPKNIDFAILRQTMYHIRETKTASGATAVQVVRYENRRLIIETHIGSGHTKEEINGLFNIAEEYIEKSTKQTKLFPIANNISNESSLISLDKCRYLGFRLNFIYSLVYQLMSRFGFTRLNEPLLVDLSIIRIVEPASKLRSLQLLKEYFGCEYAKKEMYLSVPLF